MTKSSGWRWLAGHGKHGQRVDGKQQQLADGRQRVERMQGPVAQ